VKARFFELADRLAGRLRPGETLLSHLGAERSDFVRFNQARVRQAGSVEQAYLTLRLVRERRQASATTSLLELSDLEALLGSLRDALDGLPEDPWLLVNEEPRSTATERRGALPSPESVVDEVVKKASGRDLVGIYAGGTIHRGFANSLGQKNWHEVDSFNFDWSLYLRGDQAVKTSYAGFEWDARLFSAKLDAAAQALQAFAHPARSIEPAEYRVYLAPKALEELVGMLCWGGFSARARQTKQSPLLRMQSGERLSRALQLLENTAEGIAPGFQSDGFVKPPKVTLIADGGLGDALVSPRSAREYGLATNAANGGESPESLDMAAGELPQADVLKALDRGLYLSNLWYLNYSDRPAGRITGMTRFASLWVEDGRIVAPVSPLRFDDTVYRILGANLLGLTRERELLLDASTYGERSTSSARLPGALLKGLRFTL
jgi:predicted Zn-dependent protease